MILPSPFILPPRGSPARLPFLLLPMLAVVAVVQLALPGHIDLPPGGVPARIGEAGMALPPPQVLAPPVLASRNPFAPVSNKPGSAAGAPQPPPPDPLGGAVVSGVVQRGAQRLGVVLRADGTVRYLAVGGALNGWRLAALTPGGPRFARGRHAILTPAYGAHPSPPPVPGAPGIAADDQ